MKYCLLAMYCMLIILQELSDADHDKNGHNAEYDHEAFLGRERAHDYDTYTPEESKEKLGYVNLKQFNRLFPHGFQKVIC